MEKVELSCRVSGKVHGVAYRAFIAKHAKHLALVGYVRNLPDFTVHIVAQGFREDLEQLLRHARRGPFLARVSGVDIEWRTPAERFDTFEVVF